MKQSERVQSECSILYGTKANGLYPNCYSDFFFGTCWQAFSSHGTVFLLELEIISFDGKWQLVSINIEKYVCVESGFFNHDEWVYFTCKHLFFCICYLSESPKVKGRRTIREYRHPQIDRNEGKLFVSFDQCCLIHPLI